REARAQEKTASAGQAVALFQPSRILRAVSMAATAKVLGALMLAVLPFGGSAASEIVPGRILVHTRGGGIAPPSGVRPHRLVRRLADGTNLVEIAGATAAETQVAAAALATAPEVEWAEPDGVRWRAAATVAPGPNDPLYHLEWGLALAHAQGAW